jgi:hypothetical protein
MSPTKRIIWKESLRTLFIQRKKLIKSKRKSKKRFQIIYTKLFHFLNRKKKKESKDKRKLKEKMSLKMEFQNDIVDHNQQGDNEIFNLNKIKTKKVNQFYKNFASSTQLLFS